MENDSTVESKTPIIMTRKKNQATMPVLEHLPTARDNRASFAGYFADKTP